MQSSAYVEVRLQVFLCDMFQHFTVETQFLENWLVLRQLETGGQPDEHLLMGPVTQRLFHEGLSGVGGRVTGTRHGRGLALRQQARIRLLRL